MIWTRTKPTNVGWWWYRHANRPSKHMPAETIALVEMHGFQDKELWLRTMDGYRNTVRECDGEWSSEPIEKPKEATHEPVE